jgi:hypothetical protein
MAMVMVMLAAACGGGDGGASDAGPIDAGAPDAGATPARCADVQAAATAAGGDPADGVYTLYLGGDAAKPWEAYCRGMAFADPTEYLTVAPEDNAFEASDGTTLTVSEYRRYRIDPDALAIDLLDAAFALTTEGDAHPELLPAGATDVPVGWVAFGAAGDDEGPAATGRIDLRGTGFVFAETILEDDLAEFFCTVVDGEPRPPVDGEVEISAALDVAELRAITPNGGEVLRVVADCVHLGAAEVTGGAWPLAYIGT